MKGRLFLAVKSMLFLICGTSAVPPEACFANFRWEDCGKPPVPVMYYWKPGSRCEVGLWRGCLPNLNMFQDEYECVSTCIFTIRAMPEDYHNLLNVPDEQGLVTSPPVETPAATTEGQKETTVGQPADGSTVAAAGGAGGGGNGTEVTTAKGAPAAAPTTAAG